MSFLRKWGNASSTIAGGSNGGQPAEPKEWHNETGERYFGMENFGNTCYANSVLQSLYFSKPFRELVEAHQSLASANTPSTIASSSILASPTPSSPHALASGRQAASSNINNRRPKSSGAAAQGSNARNKPSAMTGPKAGTSAGRATIANAFGGHKRQESLSAVAAAAAASTSTGTNAGAGEDSAAASSSASTAGDSTASTTSPPSLHGGAPLASTLSNTSFTGVGTPQTSAQLSLASTTLLSTLHDLFVAVSTQPKTTGTVAPQAFINQLKRDNEFFRSTLHQDAHEFFNFLVNSIAEEVEKTDAAAREKVSGKNVLRDHLPDGEGGKTWVHQLFEGILTNETRCLTCETVTSRDEAFLDLSIDIEQNSSVTACLRQFSASEMLCQRNKFSCDKCCGLQEAEKRMKIKKLPNILPLHLKRFKYEESLQRHVKLTYRVVFPFELRLFNTTDGATNLDRLYQLWAIVVHIGVGPHHGHYITIVKSGARWIVFDDHNVYPIDENDIQRYFGDTPGHGSGYVLFYQAVDLDLHELGLREAAPPSPTVTTGVPPTDVVSENGSADFYVNAGDGLRLELGSAQPVEVAQTSPVVDSSNSFFPSQPAAPPLTPFATTPATTPPSASHPFPTVPPTPPSPLTGSTPRSEKASLISVPSIKEKKGEKSDEKDGGSGWTIRGKKSLTNRIGRGLSTMGSSTTSSTSRSVSTPIPNFDPPVPPLPSSISNGHLSNGSYPPTDSPSAPTFDSPPLFHPTTFSTEPDSLPPPLPSESPSSTNTASAHPPPPSDDGSASTTSASTGTPHLAATQSPHKRSSRTSMDLSASVNSTNGGLAATLFGRKNSVRPSSSGSGAGVVASKPGPGSAVSTDSGSTSHAMGVSTSEGVASPMISVPLTLAEKKEIEKKAKEERKLREKEMERKSKELAKQKKDDEKRAKQEEKARKKSLKV